MPDNERMIYIYKDYRSPLEGEWGPYSTKERIRRNYRIEAAEAAAEIC